MIFALVSLPSERLSVASVIISLGMPLRLAVEIAWLSPGIPESTLYVGRLVFSSNSILALVILVDV